MSGDDGASAKLNHEVIDMATDDPAIMCLDCDGSGDDGSGGPCPSCDGSGFLSATLPEQEVKTNG